jgi:ABC-type polysaccharide/polyol phosphate export permease
MSAVTTRQPDLVPPSLVRSSAMVVRRNLIHIKRMPELLLDVTIQPVMFVLLFAFVFGSSIDRFKSLPISRSTILVGRSISSLIHSSIGVTVMAATGLLIGWRMRDGVAQAVGGFAILLLFGFAMIWVGIWVGSLMRSVESVNGFMFTVMFPLTFVANTFAPTSTMPTWLRTIAEWNPVSALTQSLRELWGNGPEAPASAAWPLQHAEVTTIVWSFLIAAIFAPLALAAFRQRSRD